MSYNSALYGIAVYGNSVYGRLTVFTTAVIPVESLGYVFIPQPNVVTVLVLPRGPSIAVLSGIGPST